MRTSQIISVTLPPEMLSRVVALAKKENRTMSELVREALRQYERRQWWEETNAYGRARAKALGISEKDVERLVHEYRREKHARRTPRPK